LYAKFFNRPTAQAVEPILTCDTSTDAYLRRVVPFGDQNTIFSHLHPQNPKNPILGTYNGKPMGNTHNSYTSGSKKVAACVRNIVL